MSRHGILSFLLAAGLLLGGCFSGSSQTGAQITYPAGQYLVTTPAATTITQTTTSITFSWIATPKIPEIPVISMATPIYALLISDRVNPKLAPNLDSLNAHYYEQLPSDSVAQGWAADPLYRERNAAPPVLLLIIIDRDGVPSLAGPVQLAGTVTKDDVRSILLKARGRN